VQGPAPHSDKASRRNPAVMSTNAFRTNVLFALASAAGLVYSLGRPWYAPVPAPSDPHAGVGELPGTVEQFLAGLARSVTRDDGVTAWQALGTADTGLAALAGIVGLCALAALVPSLQRPASSGAQVASLIALGWVIVQLYDQPVGREAVEMRVGGWLALIGAGVTVFSSLHLAAAPVRHRGRAPAKPPAYQAPVAPAWEPRDSVAPPVL
jgi:hypothetical protein